MKNEYRVEGEEVWIQIRVPKKLRELRGEWLETVIDAADLWKVLAINCTWSARAARKSTKKFYCVAQLWDKGEKRHYGTYLHQVVKGEPKDPKGRTLEVHHDDNDGLNNRRGNLWHLTHAENKRAHRPAEYWEAFDAAKERVKVFKKLVEIGKRVTESHGLSSRTSYDIRSGRTRNTVAAAEYWDLVRAELTDIFEPGDQRYPWLVVRPYTAGKGRIAA